MKRKTSNTITPQENVRDLYAYITGIIKNKNSKLYRINSVEDHIHMLTDIHPSISLANFMRDVKADSSIWMKESRIFPGCEGWGGGYGAFPFSDMDTRFIIDYIRNHQENPRKASFMEEYIKLLMEYGVQIVERYFP